MVASAGNVRNTVSIGDRLATSDAFRALFREGMKLVEESAAYLDGPGRNEAKALPRQVSLAYASESMRLTTRLMQLASWLLLQRAVNEGELTQSQAAAEKHKVKLTRQEVLTGSDTFALLPVCLRDIVTRSMRLQTRILHLDQLLYQGAERQPLERRPLAIDVQLARLRAAFEGGQQVRAG